MLFKGPVGLAFKGGRAAGVGGTRDGPLVVSKAFSSGEDGSESPSTVVLGRKREAMMILWFLRELIVVNDEETAEQDDDDDGEPAF